jgi:hypothetical protein
LRHEFLGVARLPELEDLLVVLDAFLLLLDILLLLDVAGWREGYAS